MKIQNKLFYTSLVILTFSLSACSDTKETASHTKTTQTQEIQNPQGHWQVKGDYLSTANKHDIKTDLAQLTLISQAYNMKVLKMHEDVKTAGNNPEKIKQILVETNTIRDYFKQKYIALHLKSSEVQNIRTLIIDNFMISEQLLHYLCKLILASMHQVKSLNNYQNAQWIYNKKLVLNLKD